MNAAQEFLEWKRNFNWDDDGLHAFLSIKRVEEIWTVVAAKEEGWEDVLDDLLSR